MKSMTGKTGYQISGRVLLTDIFNVDKTYFRAVPNYKVYVKERLKKNYTRERLKIMLSYSAAGKKRAAVSYRKTI